MTVGIKCAFRMTTSHLIIPEQCHVKCTCKHAMNLDSINVACEREGIHDEHKSKETRTETEKRCQPESSAQVVECVKRSIFFFARGSHTLVDGSKFIVKNQEINFDRVKSWYM
jgi:hypothetical protein